MLPADVDSLVREANGPVVFDADGTLWAGDVGEELLKDLGHFAEYERRVAADPIGAYTWAVEVMKGLKASDLLVRCAKLFRTRQRVFDFVAPLLERLSDVWVVSASPVWAVAPAAAALGLQKVIAVECGLTPDGALDGVVAQPIPCGQGKVHHLEKRGIKPALAFGNSDLDVPMLEYARAAVAVAPSPGLAQRAARNRWPVLRA